MSKLGIVTVLFNSASVLKEYFESLEAQTFKDFTLYIVDNKSTDDSLAVARNLAGTISFSCVFLPQEQNWGVAKGNNIGIRAALSDHSRYILLSNNDVVLNHTDTLDIMVHKMDTSNIDILCPKIYYYFNPKLMWAAGGTYCNHDTGTYHYGHEQIDNGQCDLERDIRYTPTCFAMIHADVFEKIGMMDEWYFVYYDDTDFMYRADRAGLKLVYTPDTSLLHNESICTGQGSPFKHYYLARNQLYFVRKHRPAHIYFGVIAYRLLAFTLSHIWKSPAKLWRAELAGLKDGFIRSYKGV